MGRAALLSTLLGALGLVSQAQNAQLHISPRAQILCSGPGAAMQAYLINTTAVQQIIPQGTKAMLGMSAPITSVTALAINPAPLSFSGNVATAIVPASQAISSNGS